MRYCLSEGSRVSSLDSGPVHGGSELISRETDPTREVTGCYTPAPQLLIKWSWQCLTSDITRTSTPGLATRLYFFFLGTVQSTPSENCAAGTFSTLSHRDKILQWSNKKTFSSTHGNYVKNKRPGNASQMLLSARGKFCVFLRLRFVFSPLDI